MNLEPTMPTAKNPPEQFAGDVWVDMIAVPHESDQRMSVAIVKFSPVPARPGTRTRAASTCV